MIYVQSYLLYIFFGAELGLLQFYHLHDQILFVFQYQNLINQYLSVFTVIQGQVAENIGIFLAEVEQGHPQPPCVAHTVNKCHFHGLF